jgi:hypothetical protein
MQNHKKLPQTAGDFVQLAQHALAQAQANFERARAFTEMGEAYLKNARLAGRSECKISDPPISIVKPLRSANRSGHRRYCG